MKQAKLNFLLAIIFFPFIVWAQNSKHDISSAKVVYKLTLNSQKDEIKEPMQYTLYFKKDMSRVEMKTEKGEVVMISDNLANFGYLLMDHSGHKIAMKMTRDMELRKNGITKEPKVELTRESKIIANYTCYKAIITSETAKGIKTYDVWFTNEIKGNYSYDTKINGINGLMMEFENVSDGKTYKMTALSVDATGNLSDELFKVPSDYQMMDMSKVQQGMRKQ